MQPISEILKEVGFPALLCWGASFIMLTLSLIARWRVNKTERKRWFTVLPIRGLGVFIPLTVMILYLANTSAKSNNELNQKKAIWKGEHVAMESIKDLLKKHDDKITGLDPRLQSVEGIIGYLDQSLKMDYEPKNLVPIMLFLAKEIKKIRDEG